MISVSLVLLTMNRKEAVRESFESNLRTAGYPIKEVIHVDNGSDPGFPEWFRRTYDPEIQIIHRQNQGVSKGYNRGLLLATGSHLVITGCDRIMPIHWLKQWVEAYEAIPNTGIISCYSTSAYNDIRHESDPEDLNGIRIQRAMPFEARIIPRELQLSAGFFREDFGLYGYEDWEWRHRIERISKEQGLINYVLPDLGLATELDHGDHGEYKDMKDREGKSEEKEYMVMAMREKGNPYYNPYSRIEERIL